MKRPTKLSNHPWVVAMKSYGPVPDDESSIPAVDTRHLRRTMPSSPYPSARYPRSPGVAPLDARNPSSQKGDHEQRPVRDESTLFTGSDTQAKKCSSGANPFQSVESIMSVDEFHFETDDHPFASTPWIWRFFSHYTAAHRVSEVLHLDPTPENPAEDVDLARRVLAAYRRMLAYEESQIAPADRPITGIWEMVKHEFHGEFYRLVAEEDVLGFAAYMRNAMRESLTYGLGSGHAVFEGRKTPGEGLSANIELTIDRLTSLAEAVGALPYENPEQGRYGINAMLSATDLVNRIESVIGVPIGRGTHMGNFGILVNGNIIDGRVPDDAYTMFRAKTIVDTFNLQGVCEIGGGLGGNAIQAVRMGIPAYTIFDIPVVCSIQAWFLAKSLDSGSVQLFGEDIATHKVAIRPYWELHDRSRPFSLVINRDSIPEIPIEYARSYIKEISERRAYLLSINQESGGLTNEAGKIQLRVGNLIKETVGMKCIARHRAWTREGYVEELFGPA